MKWRQNMETDKIKTLCRLSEKYADDFNAFENHITSDAKKLTIEFPYQTIIFNLDDYPEFRPLVDKIKEYILKSEKKRQSEIKLAIMKILGE